MAHELGMPAPAGAPPAGAARVPDHLQRNARLALVALLVGLGIWTIRSFLPAVAWGGILTIAIWPIYVKARARWFGGRSKLTLPILFTLAIALVFGLPFVFLAVEAVHEAHDLLTLFHNAATSGIPVPDWVSHLPFGSDTVTEWWRQTLSTPGGSTAMLKRVNRGSVLVLTRSFGFSVAHRGVIFFFMLLTLFILLRDGESVVRSLLHASAKLFGERGERIARQMVSSVHGTVDGLVLVGLGEGVLMGIVYVFAGVPHPTLLGALTGVAAIIPFAVFVVFGIVGALLLVQGATVAAIVVVSIGTVMVLLADHLIRPVLIGGATRLPFLWVLFGILGGVETWGVVGLFIGPALMAALILLWREFTEDAVPEPVATPATPTPARPAPPETRLASRPS